MIHRRHHVAILGLIFLALALGARAAESDETLKLCATCHGEDGRPSDPTIPIIWGQEFYYLYVQLKDYKSGLRANPIMSAIVAPLEKEQMQALAQHFSEQPWPSIDAVVSDAEMYRAHSATVAGMCTQCHLGSYTGNSRIPRVAGQQPEYLLRTMREFRDKVRLNAPAKGSLFETYDDEDITAMARYLGAM